MQGAKIECSAELPEGPVRPQVLLPVLQDLSSAIGEIVVRNAEQVGRPVSCRAGCGACCRQLVPISAAEAQALAEWLDGQPEERQAVLRERFRQAAARLEETGIAAELRAIRWQRRDRESTHELGMRYFALGVACPFLEEEQCTIHPIRPLRCREYFVVSPAAHCADPAHHEIVNVEPSVLLSRLVSRWDAKGEPQQPPELIVLAMLEEWSASATPATGEPPRRTAPELLQEFLSALTQDAQAPSTDPRNRKLPDIQPQRSDA